MSQRRLNKFCLQGTISLVLLALVVSNRRNTTPPRIACWVLRDDMLSEPSKASVAISRGWGKSCDSLTFVDRSTPKIYNDWYEGYSNLSSKSFRAWQYMYSTHKGADFFLKADLDTIIFPAHLRTYLSRFSSHEPHYIGKHFVNEKQVNFIAGATIILSYAALERFVEASLSENSLCSRHNFIKNGPAEDLALGACLNEIGIYPHNSRDRRGRERFMVFNPVFMQHGANGTLPDWYLRYSFNKKIGRDCCSKDAISFHQIGFSNAAK